jgi:hypothetical protein
MAIHTICKTSNLIEHHSNYYKYNEFKLIDDIISNNNIQFIYVKRDIAEKNVDTIANL